MKLITEELLNKVTSQAKVNPRLRMNYNFHASMDEPVHRMLNALEPDTYLPPHRHVDKEETYLLLRGSMWVLFYDDYGNVTDKVLLNPLEGKYGLEIPSGTWHSIIVLESGTVIFEIKKGPYSPLPAKDIASWAPAPSDVKGAEAFMNKMLEMNL
nr:WbuC family cupin fold metalloprotein [uncultured Bacteroides sp.]